MNGHLSSDRHYNAYNTKDSGHYSERNGSKSLADCPVNIHTKCTGSDMKGAQNKEAKLRSAFAVVRQGPNENHQNWQHLAVQC